MSQESYESNSDSVESSDENRTPSHFCYFNYDEFYNSNPLILPPDKDESKLMDQLQKELSDLTSEEKQDQIKKQIKTLRKDIIVMRVHRLRKLENVVECGNLFSFGSDSSYHKAKTNLTFQTTRGEEICFLHDVPVGTPLGLEKIYEMLRSEILQKEQYHQTMLEYQKRLNEIENIEKSPERETSIGEGLKSDISTVLNDTVQFFKKNAQLIIGKGDFEGGKDLFTRVAQILKKIH